MANAIDFLFSNLHATPFLYEQTDLGACTKCNSMPIIITETDPYAFMYIYTKCNKVHVHVCGISYIYCKYIKQSYLSYLFTCSFMEANLPASVTLTKTTHLSLIIAQ